MYQTEALSNTTDTRHTILKLGGLKYATSLDLKMGYYHIKLDPQSQKLCTIVLPWGK
jgi:hypothetical protein